ncbi:MAG: hypothetical protein Q8P45_03480 [Candidatus Harrisonbacteria bacterium]|nr:hypothetical protein [Candidatus Harrisonbacteria bacterium]
MATTSSYKQRLTISLAGTAGILIAIVLAMIFVGVDISKRERKIHELRQSSAEQNRLIAALGDIQQDAEKASLLTPELQTQLPGRDDLISFPRELERLANEYDVELGFEFGTEGQSTPEKAGFIKYRMAMAGSLEALNAFLQAFEDHSYYIEVDSVDVTTRAIGGYALQTSGQILTR